jgi:hypothetical protein
MRGVVPIVLAVVALVAPEQADANDEIVRGSVVKIEAQEIYVNLGVERGVSGGAALRLKRPVKLRHPVTRAMVEDWIPIGSATVTQAGAVMSRAVIGELVAQVKVGDLAEILVDRPDRHDPGPATPTAPPTPPQGPPVDAVTAEVLGLFASLVGQPLEVRIASWERYLSVRPASPFAAEIRRDLDQLHALREELDPRPGAQTASVSVAVTHGAPPTAVAGAQLPVVFVLEQPERVASAYLHYRPRGERGYRRVLLVREHDIYLRGAVPAEVVQAPGLDYFVEVSTPTGQSGLAVGSPSEPIAVAVASPTLRDQFGARPGRSSVKIAADYLDFATLDRRAGDRTDRMFTANVDFIYRLDGVVQSVGVGYGVYAGTGGFADRAWTPAMMAPRSGFHYGYADVEVGGVAEGVPLSAGGQLIAGVGKDGFGMGAEGRVRIGARDATNLAVIGRTVAQVGFVSDVRFAARPIRPLMVGVSVGATNQPNQGDVGVRLGTELEVLAIENVSVLLRASWQGRTTSHGGLGGGAGLGFYW